MLKLYIADTDLDFIDRIKRFLRRRCSIKLIGSASSGKQALLDIACLKPDVVLMDIQLPELDGLALLRETRRLRVVPTVIICTRFYSHASMEWAYQYGASFFFCKPIEPERLSELIIDCALSAAKAGLSSDSDESETTANEKEEVSRLLLKGMGIPSNLNGCAYLLASVSLLSRDALLMRNLSSGLYSELAKRFDTTPARVERSLRNAISIGYHRGSMCQVFPTRPSNRRFLEYLISQTNSLDLNRDNPNPDM